MPQPSQTTPPDNGLYDFVRVIVAGDAANSRASIGAIRQRLRMRGAWSVQRGKARIHISSRRSRITCTRMTPRCTWRRQRTAPKSRKPSSTKGADCFAKNRRGAQPLHYAADANAGNPAAQAATIACLIRAGADPNATDKSGVTPLHRAVRTRSAAAVEALLAGGAEPRGRNGSGSTPLHLAVQNTGASHSGTPQAIDQQRLIIDLLLRAGATPDDRDENGKAVYDAARADWIRALL